MTSEESSRDDFDFRCSPRDDILKDILEDIGDEKAVHEEIAAHHKG